MKEFFFKIKSGIYEINITKYLFKFYFQKTKFF